MTLNRRLSLLTAILLPVTLVGCGGGGADHAAAAAGNRGGRERGARRAFGRGVGKAPSAAVPVQVAPVVRRSISSYIETNGVLEAENEVDVVARIGGPVVRLETEEGRQVRKGQLLALIDDREAKAELDVATVNRDDAKLAFERTKTSFAQGLVSREAYDTAASKLKSAQAQLESAKLKLDYTRIRAPFNGLVVKRYIKLATNVSVGTPLFRVSNFTPLLCPIQVPEKELSKVRVGQRAMLRVEAFGDRAFPARVLRISPVVDASTGTFTVTLEAGAHGKLRPGMFASVALETEVHDRALVIPKSALVLDSIGDTVFVKSGGKAARREVRLGFRDRGDVEVLQGLKEGEQVIVLGQEGLSNGTPVTVLSEQPPSQAASSVGPEPGDRGASGDTRTVSPGLGGRIPPRFLERLRTASPKDLERIKKRMRDRGMSNAQIERLVRRARGKSE